jgi:hypothetical protein
VKELTLSIDAGEPQTVNRVTSGTGGGLIISNVTLHTPGEHELTFTLHIEVIAVPQSTSGPGKTGVLLHEYELILKGKVNVPGSIGHK